ncbi:MAG TPA: beta-N-acetylhexosaminidase [Anaerolinea thermolimosa]|uniref:beta-N-acetylhexosaminidase n=1 Tax=Anaerolinea thermolimosa TaxID=229919 RepID=A0A3D1JIH4_9CHLR|nr:beta-N-acetylhexosaminidase [Anaerolinea thermolimosa]
MPAYPPILPRPRHLTPREGQFTFSAQTALLADEAAEGVAAFLRDDLARVAGIRLMPGDSSGNRVEFRLDEGLAALGEEGYRLEVSPQRILARAPAPRGLFYALQTLRQLLPVEIYSPTLQPGIEWCVPCVEIEDRPRFSWRGAMLDVARHFMPLEFIFQWIDLLALHKMNRFHWHLTDDQGWRIEIKKYPRLTEVGAWRKQTMVGHFDGRLEGLVFDGIPHGGFYTQEEVRRVVEYARARFVQVVPEIEMPGHSQAAIAAYPYLGNTGEAVEVSQVWGIHEHVFNVEERTFQFLTDVLEEVLDLFPDAFIHVGGDECPKKEWRESPSAQARMRELGLKNEDELQSWFIRRIDRFLTEQGRRLIGWDEILEGGLAENAAVMSWRGEEGGIAAANAGHDVVMAPYTFTYLDYYQSEDRAREPLAIGGYLPLEKVYLYDPLPAAIAPDRVHHVLGTQAQLWTEYIATPQHCQYMAFPRLCALAETAWLPPEQKDLADFKRRLRTHLRRLDVLGVAYRRPEDPD